MFPLCFVSESVSSFEGNHRSPGQNAGRQKSPTDFRSGGGGGMISSSSDRQVNLSRSERQVNTNEQRAYQSNSKNSVQGRRSLSKESDVGNGIASGGGGAEAVKADIPNGAAKPQRSKCRDNELKATASTASAGSAASTLSH